MKIAVTCQNRKTVTNHVGRCRKFRVYDVEGSDIVHEKLIELPKAMSFHEHHDSSPHPLDEVDVLITASMGPGMARRLAKKNILALVTTETDPEKAVGEYLAGQLPQVAVGSATH